MTHVIDAVFEDGVFRPVDASPPLANGQHVRIVVETNGDGGDALDLATRVYDGLSDADIEDVERIALDRTRFFSGPIK